MLITTQAKRERERDKPLAQKQLVKLKKNRNPLLAHHAAPFLLFTLTHEANIGRPSRPTAQHRVIPVQMGPYSLDVTQFR